MREFSQEELNSIKNELEEIKKKNYDIGDVSQLMKDLVISQHGDEDWSTSGYWVRAEQYFKKSLF